MLNVKKWLPAILLSSAALLSTQMAQADEWHEGMPWRFDQHHWHPEQHPYYSHAMTDLRVARDLLDRPDIPPVAHEERHAVDEINQALREMHDAAIDDGKDPFARTPPDAGFRPEGRFHDALRLLDKARHDVSHREDDPYLRDLQHRILGHIDEAERSVQIVVSHFPR